jgi:hypothetical protein
MKQQVRGPWLFVATVCLAVGACDFSKEGLGGVTDTERAGAGGSAGGGRGGTGRGGTGATAGRAGTGATGGSGMASTPGSGGSAAPATDASNGGFGVTGSPVTSDAAAAADAPPPPSDVALADAAAAPVDAAVATGKGDCPRGEGTLALCLRFENGVLDESEPRTMVNASGLDYEAGLTGQAGRFGAGTAVRVGPAGLTAGSFTVEAWVRPQALPGAGQRAGIVDRELHFGLFVQPGGDLVCFTGAGTATVPAALRPGQWSAVACTGGAGGVVLYVDGVRRASAGAGAGVVAPPGQPEIAVGSNSPAGDNFHGLIDNVRLWTGARTQPQICQAAHGCE